MLLGLAAFVSGLRILSGLIHGLGEVRSLRGFVAAFLGIPLAIALALMFAAMYGRTVGPRMERAILGGLFTTAAVWTVGLGAPLLPFLGSPISTETVSMISGIFLIVATLAWGWWIAANVLFDADHEVQRSIGERTERQEPEES